MSITKSPHKIISLAGGEDTSASARISVLENNEYKITYFESVNADSGTITIPTGATIILDEFSAGVDAYVSTVINGRPTGEFPKTAGGLAVDVASFDAAGNFTLTGTPNTYPVAIIYILKIKAVDYQNLTIDNILDFEDIGAERVINKAVDFSIINDTLYPTTLAVENRFALKQSQLNSGGTITIGSFGGTGTNDDIRVSAANWYIQPTGLNYFTSGNTDYLDVVPAASGMQRYIGIYGTTSNSIVFVEGVDAVLATYPTQPANTAIIGYVLVSDAGMTITQDLSGYLLKADKATQAETQTGTNNDKYLTPASGHNVYLKKDPQTLSIASSTAPAINSDLYTFVTITALAADITSFTANLTGTPVLNRRLVITIKDDGTARSITWGAKFSAYAASLPTSTTAGKEMTVAFLYDTVTAKWRCMFVGQEP